jgi:hypothetical protein
MESGDTCRRRFMTFGTFAEGGGGGIVWSSTDRWTPNHRPAARLSSGGMSGEGGAGIC